MSSFDRRQFIHRNAAALAGVALSPMTMPGGATSLVHFDKEPNP
jgi:hypothetical protein